MIVSKLYNSRIFRFTCLIITATLLLQVNVCSQHFTETTKSKFITKFRFYLTNRGIIIIKGQFGNYRDTLNFVLDTGCGGISLDSTTAKHFNLTPTSTEETIRGISSNKSAEFLFNQQLRLPRLQTNNLDFHINDYTFLSDAHNIKIDGVIGYSFLKSYIVKVNYDDLTIEVWKPGKIEYPKDGYVINTRANKLAAIDATVNDNRKIDSRFYFDTGADMCFLLSDKYIADSNVLSNNKKIVLSGGEGLGGKKEMRLTTLDNIKLGPYSIKKVPAYIFEDSYNVSNYPVTGGIIGNELMQRFNVVINYPADEIHLVANSMFNTPFNYSYIGCTIFNENGKVIIRDIVKDSPAQLAGLQNDDVIFGIDNNFKNDVDEYKVLLSKTGAKLKVFLLRGNRVKSTIVEVQSIL